MKYQRKTFEEYLMDEHQKEYIGSKDTALEAFTQWLEDLEIEEWLIYGHEYGIERVIRAIDNVEKSINFIRSGKDDL